MGGRRLIFAPFFFCGARIPRAGGFARASEAAVATRAKRGEREMGGVAPRRRAARGVRHTARSHRPAATMATAISKKRKVRGEGRAAPRAGGEEARARARAAGGARAPRRALRQPSFLFLGGRFRRRARGRAGAAAARARGAPVRAPLGDPRRRATVQAPTPGSRQERAPETPRVPPPRAPHALAARVGFWQPAAKNREEKKKRGRRPAPAPAHATRYGTRGEARPPVAPRAVPRRVCEQLHAACRTCRLRARCAERSRPTGGLLSGAVRCGVRFTRGLSLPLSRAWEHVLTPPGLPHGRAPAQFIADGVFYAELNEMLMRELAEDGYSGVEVRVTPMRTEIIIRATRTQNVLGEKGRRIRELTAVVQKRFNFPEGSVELYAEKVANRGLCAVAQCESLRYKLLGGLAVRRACYGVLRFVMESGAKGCEVIVAGKMRAARAKVMKFKDGYMISTGTPVKEYIDSAVRHVAMRQGMMGLHVKIMLDHDPAGKTGPKTPLPDNIHVITPKDEDDGAKPIVGKDA